MYIYQLANHPTAINAFFCAIFKINQFFVMNISYIPNCGESKRVLILIDSTYYCGCFAGTKKELISSIEKKYKRKRKYLDDYLSKVNQIDNEKPFSLCDIESLNYIFIFACKNGFLELIIFLLGMNIVFSESVLRNGIIANLMYNKNWQEVNDFLNNYIDNLG